MDEKSNRQMLRLQHLQKKRIQVATTSTPRAFLSNPVWGTIFHKLAIVH